MLLCLTHFPDRCRFIGASRHDDIQCLPRRKLVSNGALKGLAAIADAKRCLRFCSEPCRDRLNTGIEELHLRFCGRANGEGCACSEGTGHKTILIAAMPAGGTISTPPVCVAQSVLVRRHHQYSNALR